MVFLFLVEHIEITIILIISCIFHSICRDYERKNVLPSEFYLRYLKPCSNVVWLISEIVFSFILFETCVFKMGQEYTTFLHYEEIGHLFHIEETKNMFAVTKNYPVTEFVQIFYANDIKIGERIATCLILALILMITIKFVYTYIKGERKQLINGLTNFLLSVIGLETIIVCDDFLYIFFTNADIRIFIVVKWLFMILYLPLWWYVSSRWKKRKNLNKT